MGVIYVVSAEEAAGKTAIGAGLGKLLLDQGKKVGYLKPSVSEGGAEGDVAFMRQILDLTDAVNTLDVLNGRDVVFVEGRIGASAGDALSKDAYGAVREMKAKVIVVEAYTGQASRYTDSYKGFGDSLLGVVVTKVPQSQLESARGVASASGIKVLGVIPEDRTLLSVSVGELARNIQGEILNNTDKAPELVENYMLGAMVVDSGLDYFGRKDKKAAVVRYDRPDMQLAALETPTRCLVLSGSEGAPVYSVREKAENHGIPIVSTAASTGDIIAGIEDVLAKARFTQEGKLPRMVEAVKQNLDLKSVL